MIADIKPKTIIAGVAVAVISALVVDAVKRSRTKNKAVANTDEPQFKNWTGDNQFFETDGDTHVENNLHLRMIPLDKNNTPYKCKCKDHA